MPLIIGFVLFLKTDKVNWKEWLAGFGFSLLLAVIFHISAVMGMTDDIETFSGHIIQATHYPEWIEEYQEAIYKDETYYTTDQKGNRTSHTRRVFSHYETRHRTHSERWECVTTLHTKSISKDFFDEISKNFANLTTEKPYKGGFDGGDPYIYVAYNKTGYVYPVTDIRHFENRVKAAPTVFSFPKVPTNVAVYNWPENGDWLHSQRLINENRISLLEFDRMNTRLGPIKKINVIMINFGNQDSSIAQWQQAKFVGGKKNDLVICYGQVNTNNMPTWCFVFGWSKSELAKKNIQTILLTNPINDSILPIIEREIVLNYEKRDWNDFAYISIEPPTWSYVLYFMLMFAFQVAYWWWCLINDFSQFEYSKRVTLSKIKSFNRSRYGI